LKIRRATIKGTSVRQASSPETEPNFYTMTFLPKRIEAGVQGNSKEACVVDPEPMADSVSNTKKIAPVHPVCIPYVYGNYVKNSPIECKQAVNGHPNQLLAVDPIPLRQSTLSMHGCPEPTTFTPTVLVRSSVSDGDFYNQRQDESSSSQPDLNEADFDEFLRHIDNDFGCLRPTTPRGVEASISSSTQSLSAQLHHSVFRENVTIII
jgi:hypothetical protein